MVTYSNCHSGVERDAFLGLICSPMASVERGVPCPQPSGEEGGGEDWEAPGSHREGWGWLWGLQCGRARVGAGGVPAAVLFPDELRGMKRPFKTAGRGLGLIKCNPFRNCKHFHMTRFQPHPDTQDPGLFRQSAGTREGARCLWVLLVLQVGGITSDALLRPCKAWCPGMLCGSACDSCPHSGACVGWLVLRQVKYSPRERLSSRKLLPFKGLAILLPILLKAKTGKVFRLLGCLARSWVWSSCNSGWILCAALVRAVGTDAWC